jgi:hypothetical protein
VGSLRGARLGLAALIALGALGMLAPAASADPYIGVDAYVMAAPIILVPINFPINGLLLLLIRRFSSRASKVRPHERVMNQVLDFGAAVLLFTLIGAVIDWFVEMGIYVLEDVGAVTAFCLGLVPIGISCYLICLRYLGMGRATSAAGATFVTAINFLSWLILMATPNEVFYYACIPVLILAWVFFEVALVRDAVHSVRRPVPIKVAKERLFPASDGRDHDMTRSHTMPTRDLGRLRSELWVADLFLLFIVIVMSIVMSSLAWPY